MTAAFTRVLGRSGIEVSALGMGCWAIGGPWTFNGAPAGWSEVDDAESVRALRRAFDLGVTFFDTAANYGAGHSERLLGRAFGRAARRGRHRHQVRLRRRRGRHRSRRTATTRPTSDVASHLRDDLDASLATTRHRLRRRLPTSRRGLSVERALEARDVLEELVAEGRSAPTAGAPIGSTRCEHSRRCRGAGSSSKGSASSTTPTRSCSRCARSSTSRASTADRSAWACSPASSRRRPRSPPTTSATVAAMAPRLPRRQDQPRSGWTSSPSIREVLTSEGRTLAQGALAWIWARSPRHHPDPRVQDRRSGRGELRRTRRAAR